jgi:hypothetical protein
MSFEDCFVTITSTIREVSHPRAPASFIAAVSRLGYGEPEMRTLLANRVVWNQGRTNTGG